MTNDLRLLYGIGTIQAGSDQQARLDEMIDRLKTDELYVSVAPSVPTKCIDGRSGSRGYAPNAAGGTETLMVADDLTYRRFSAETTLESYANVINALQAADQPIGGHTDSHARDAASGCGANDKLEQIYRFIAQRGDVIRNMATQLGVEVASDIHDMIIANATRRTEFSPGSELLTVLRTAGGEAVVDPLIGDHREVVAVINTQAGTTLDRQALEAEFGPEYEAFNVDVWSFGAAAQVLTDSEDRIPALVVAAVYYNLATAHVLCGPDMRVIVR